MNRQLISSGGPWEAKGGYSRAVRVDDHVYVAGTTAMKDGKLVGPGDVVAQTRQIMTTIITALHEAGASIGDVVRYRIYLTNIEDNLRPWSRCSANTSAKSAPPARWSRFPALIAPGDAHRNRSRRHSRERNHDGRVAVPSMNENGRSHAWNRPFLLTASSGGLRRHASGQAEPVCASGRSSTRCRAASLRRRARARA